MFIAGLVPGLLCAVVLMLPSTLSPAKLTLNPRVKAGLGQRGGVLAGTGLACAVPHFSVVGGIRANIFTPTEAGAVAC